jgi:NADH-quinone oxidoreductase subunit C
MESLEKVKARIEAAVPGAQVVMVPNALGESQASLLLNSHHALEVARFLRDDPELRFDYLSNVTGVDWLDRVVKEKIPKEVDGAMKEEVVERTEPGYLEAVYHLYSMSLKQGPLILRMRTSNRSDQVRLASLTPVWKSAEFQEREIYDLYGIVFEGHPDLRRILMWDGYEDHPMRKDYVEPDDYEYEPTPHSEILEKSRAHYPEEARK